MSTFFAAENGAQAGETFWDPVFLKYFLHVYLVHVNPSALSDPLYRELRSYCEILDGLLKGKTMEVMDLVVMQFKATTLAYEEGNWNAARWLQLLPTHTGAGSVSETDKSNARGLEMQDIKSRDLKARVSTGKPG